MVIKHSSRYCVSQNEQTLHNHSSFLMSVDLSVKECLQCGTAFSDSVLLYNNNNNAQILDVVWHRYVRMH